MTTVTATITIYQGVGENRIITLPGEPIEVSEVEAQFLSDLGISETPTTEPTPPGENSDESPCDEEHIISLIIDAIEQLSEDDFANNGKPKIQPLENVLGFDITSEQRNEAWDIYQEQQEDDDGDS